MKSETQIKSEFNKALSTKDLLQLQPKQFINKKINLKVTGVSEIQTANNGNTFRRISMKDKYAKINMRIWGNEADFKFKAGDIISVEKFSLEDFPKGKNTLKDIHYEARRTIVLEVKDKNIITEFKLIEEFKIGVAEFITDQLYYKVLYILLISSRD